MKYFARINFSDLLIRRVLARLILAKMLSILATFFNPLAARIFIVFGQFIRGQSVTQGSMGRVAPRYPKLLPTSVSRSIKRSNLKDEISRHWQLKG